jgi:hypothetical protein
MMPSDAVRCSGLNSFPVRYPFLDLACWLARTASKAPATAELLDRHDPHPRQDRHSVARCSALDSTGAMNLDHSGVMWAVSRYRRMLPTITGQMFGVQNHEVASML